jgi:TetR/AcrR family transcriptional repressor of nem operon
MILLLDNIPTSWYINSMGRPRKNNDEISTKEKVLQASLAVIRAKGYSATTVEDLCVAAGVTKGTFFHYFKTKEDLAVSSAEYWSQITGNLFASADYHKHADPLDRVLGYVDFRKDLIRGGIPDFTCLVGTMVQETYGSHTEIRDACRDSIFTHAATLENDIEETKKLYVPNAEWTARGLALHTQAVLQGAFILAKAADSASLAVQSVDHLKAYLELLFHKNQN